MYHSVSIEQSNASHSGPTARMIISRSLSFIAAGCIVVYMVLMVRTISLINERKDIRAEIRNTQVAISDSEVRYFELAQSIDKKVIENLGFTESTVPVFAYTHPDYPTVAVAR
ncbi:MAG TPA: hypothetical protein PKZ56_01835 [Candidatus Paceibacterota bacterium]|nr:hypothetical protein [Candidatus Paceibacterota bacterium]